MWLDAIWACLGFVQWLLGGPPAVLQTHYPLKFKSLQNGKLQSTKTLDSKSGNGIT